MLLSTYPPVLARLSAGRGSYRPPVSRIICTLLAESTLCWPLFNRGSAICVIS